MRRLADIADCIKHKITVKVSVYCGLLYQALPHSRMRVYDVAGRMEENASLRLFSLGNFKKETSTLKCIIRNT